MYKAERYRWVILAAIIPIIIATEIFWLTFAPVSSVAEAFYSTSGMVISLMSVSYMIMYIIFTIPASWVIDKYGYRVSLIIGAVLTAVFGVLRAAFASNLVLVMVFQFAIAAGQPFLINISTKVPANWFPEHERSTAAGLLTMAQYLGFVVPMVLSPMLAESGIPRLLWVYAIIAVVCAVISIVFTKERPATPPGPEAPKEDLSLRSMLKLLKNSNFVYVLIIAFIAMGIFNTVLTLIEGILTPRGMTTDQAGIVGAVFVLAGVAGAVALPIISDKMRKRVPLFIVGLSALGPLYLGMTFINSFWLVAVIAGLAGFTIMGLAPIVFQHGAEVAYPVQEGTSYGLILLMGQISGSLFVLIFGAIGGSTMTLPMILAVVLTVLEVIIACKMRESDTLLKLRG